MTLDRWLLFSLIVGGVIVLLWLIYWVYRAKLLEREERKLMIERGMTPPAPALAGWPGVRAREQELLYQERRLRIEKGMDLGELDATPNSIVKVLREKDPRILLRRGLVSVAIGLGLLAPFSILRLGGAPVSDEAMNFSLFIAVFGPVVALYGAAHILYYGLTKNRRSEAASPNSPDSRSGS